MRAIEDRSEGNPFFVEEIVRHLIDAGSLRRDERGGWTVAGSVGSVDIPATVHGVIAARIDRLAEDTRQDLLQASVIGRNFYRQLLRSLSTQDDVEFDRSLRSLQDHQLVFLKRRSRNRSMHSSMHWFRRLHTEPCFSSSASCFIVGWPTPSSSCTRARSGSYGILAYHYTKAEDWQNAQTYLLKAGDQSVSMAADREAVAYYQQAMSALLRAFDETADCGLARSGAVVRGGNRAFLVGRCLGDLLDSARIFYRRVSQTCGQPTRAPPPRRPFSRGATTSGESTRNASRW